MEDAYPVGLQFTQGADMCSLHKTIVGRGAMKNKKYGCYCCNINRDDLAKPNVLRCDECMLLGINHPCYHPAVLDEDLMQHLNEEYNVMVRDYPYLLTCDFKLLHICSGTMAVRDIRSDYCHIDFDVANSTVPNRLPFQTLLEKELRLRDKQILPHMEGNWIGVKDLLLIEQRFFC
jgi:hypothetical protein